MKPQESNVQQKSNFKCDAPALFISGGNQLEEQVGPANCDGRISDLIHDEQRHSGVEADFLGKPSLTFSLEQGIDEFCQDCPVDAFPSPDAA